MAFKPFLIATLASAALASQAQALVTQTVNVSFDPTPDQIVNGDDVTDGATISNAGGPIVDAITASIAGDRFSAIGSVGQFGDLGLQGVLFRTGEMRAQVDIEADEFINPFATAQEAQINFIIDGGEFQMVAGDGSTIELQLTISRDNQTVFQTGFDLTAIGGFGVDTDFQPFGADIGAFQPSSSTVEIPFAFGSASLGVIQPNQRFSIDYQIVIVAETVGFGEIVRFEFSDPFNVSGFGDFPTVTFSDAQAVPVPATAPLLLGALGLFGLIHRRRPGSRQLI